MVAITETQTQGGRLVDNWLGKEGLEARRRIFDELHGLSGRNVGPDLAAYATTAYGLFKSACEIQDAPQKSAQTDILEKNALGRSMGTIRLATEILRFVEDRADTEATIPNRQLEEEGSRSYRGTVRSIRSEIDRLMDTLTLASYRYYVRK